MASRPPPATDDEAFDRLPPEPPPVSRRELFRRITRTDFDGGSRISNPMISVPAPSDPPRRWQSRSRR